MKKKISLLFIFIFIFIKLNIEKLYADTDAETMFGAANIDSNLIGGSLDLIPTINNIAGYIIGLFYFISVMLIIYGGFIILTSGGEEEKMKKGKNIVIYVILGLILVFLASNITNWIIDIMDEGGAAIIGTT